MRVLDNLALVESKDEIKPDRLLILKIMTVATVLGVLAGLYAALVYAGTDTTQGHIQRIFYIHVSSFSGAFIAFATTVIGGIMYLRTRNIKWDTLAYTGVEVGFTFSLITLSTGAIWARPIWNTWWTWDPRLTSAAIMALTYAAYLMLRNGIENPGHRRLFSSVYGILAISTVIFTFVIIRIRPDTIHPTVIGSASSEAAKGTFAMSDSMTTVMSVNSIVWCCLLTPTLMWWRIRLENLLEHVQHTKFEILDS